MTTTIPLALSALLLAPPGAPRGLPWIEDDLPRALAEAQRRQVPVVVDVWTPW